MLNLRACITAVLMDGRPRKLEEVLPYLLGRVSAPKAKRHYDQAVKRFQTHQTRALEYKIRSGRWRLISTAMNSMRREGLLRIEKAPGQKSYRGATLCLTDKSLRATKTRGNLGSVRGLWNELRWAHRQGLIEVSVRPLPRQGEEANGLIEEEPVSEEVAPTT